MSVFNHKGSKGMNGESKVVGIKVPANSVNFVRDSVTS